MDDGTDEDGQVGPDEMGQDERLGTYLPDLLYPLLFQLEQVLPPIAYLSVLYSDYFVVCFFGVDGDLGDEEFGVVAVALQVGALLLDCLDLVDQFAEFLELLYFLDCFRILIALE